MFSLDSVKLVEVDEGKVKLLVPDLAYYSGNRVEPAWAPVFYNPAMKVSRDISVAIVESYSQLEGRESISICEPLSATGVRGLRYAAEVPAVSEVVLNDRSPLAYKLALTNTNRNDLNGKVRVYNREARALLTELAEKDVRFDIVDVDPFGTPAPFVESALLTLRHRGLLMLTATDLAPLFGIKPSSCMRKYFAKPMLSEFSKEIGARILAAFVAREAAKLGLAARPIYTFLVRHSLRLIAIIERSKSKAFRTLSQLGFVIYCPRCLYRAVEKDVLRNLECPLCRGKTLVAGPLWIGDLWDEKYAQMILKNYSERRYLSAEGLKLVKLVALEAGKPPLYTTVTSIARLASLKEEPSPLKVVERIAQSGGSASLTHFDSKGVRSSFQPQDVARLLSTD
jgi:tRNA (guanine26-N2/guanine27-N2)-dimethyltransferase